MGAIMPEYVLFLFQPIVGALLFPDLDRSIEEGNARVPEIRSLGKATLRSRRSRTMTSALPALIGFSAPVFSPLSLRRLVAYPPATRSGRNSRRDAGCCAVAVGRCCPRRI